jgi:UDP-N-acetylmuramyl pentapeptide synthase
MTYLVVIFLGLSFLISLLKELFIWTYLAQEKKYLLKRILAHFFSSDSVNSTLTLNHLFKIFFLLLISLLLLATPFVTRSFDSSQIDSFTQISLWIISLATLAIFLFDVFLFFKDLFRKTFLMPRFSFEMTLLFGVTAFVALLFALLISKNLLLFSITSILTTLLLGFIICFFILLSKPFSFLLKKYYFSLARKRLKLHKKLVTVLITGSSNKQFTKSYISQILKSHFKVLSNSYRQNSLPDILQLINKELEPEHDFLVLDLEPFEKNDLSKIIEILKPDIGILTGINKTNLNFLKETQNSFHLFSELFKKMPLKSLKITNLDNPVISQNLSELPQDTFFYSLKMTQKEKVLFPSNFTKYPQGSSLDLEINGRTLHFNPPFSSKEEISSLLCAILVALKAQIPPDDIEHSIDSLKPIPGLLNVTKTKKGSILIDNTESTNYQNLFSAIEYITLYPDYEKIIIFKDFLELGKDAKEIHENLLATASKEARLAIFSGKIYSNIFKNKLPNVLVETRPTEIENLILAKTKAPRAILISGKNNIKALEILKENL